MAGNDQAADARLGLLNIAIIVCIATVIADYATAVCKTVVIPKKFIFNSENRISDVAVFRSYQV